jgi:hypothetical protein
MSNIDKDDSDEVFHVAAANYAHATDGFSIEDGFGIRLDNTLTDIDITNRPAYTILEFEIDYIGPTYSTIDFWSGFPFSLYSGTTAFGGPQPYNLIDPVVVNGVTYSYNDPSRGWPTSYPINHLATNAVVETEYFYNRAQINFYFLEILGDDTYNHKYAFRNIKYTEVDMIPFFRYATESRINQSILAPLSAVAPPINYSDSEFSLIDSINITETLFETAVNPVINLSGAGSIESKGTTLPFRPLVDIRTETAIRNPATTRPTFVDSPSTPKLGPSAES